MYRRWLANLPWHIHLYTNKKPTPIGVMDSHRFIVTDIPSVTHSCRLTAISRGTFIAREGFGRGPVTKTMFWISWGRLLTALVTVTMFWIWWRKLLTASAIVIMLTVSWRRLLTSLVTASWRRLLTSLATVTLFSVLWRRLLTSLVTVTVHSLRAQTADFFSHSDPVLSLMAQTADFFSHSDPVLSLMAQTADFFSHSDPVLSLMAQTADFFSHSDPVLSLMTQTADFFSHSDAVHSLMAQTADIFSHSLMAQTADFFSHSDPVLSLMAQTADFFSHSLMAQTADFFSHSDPVLNLIAQTADFFKPVLNWTNVCSPNILRTVLRTMIRFIIELLVWQTWFGQFDELYFVLNWLVMRCKLRPNLRQTRSRQHDRKCSLKSSQVKSIYFNHPSQGNSTNCYLILGPRDKAAPPTSQQIKIYPPKRLKDLATPSFIFIFISSSSTGELYSEPVRGSVRRIGRMFPEYVDRSFLDPEYSFVAVGLILRTIFAKQKFAQLRTNYIRRILPTMSANKCSSS